jgi:hypothetical protein
MKTLVEHNIVSLVAFVFYSAEKGDYYVNYGGGRVFVAPDARGLIKTVGWYEVKIFEFPLGKYFIPIKLLGTIEEILSAADWDIVTEEGERVLVSLNTSPSFYMWIDKGILAEQSK